MLENVQQKLIETLFHDVENSMDVVYRYYYGVREVPPRNLVFIFSNILFFPHKKIKPGFFFK